MLPNVWKFVVFSRNGVDSCELISKNLIWDYVYQIALFIDNNIKVSSVPAIILLQFYKDFNSRHSYYN